MIGLMPSRARNMAVAEPPGPPPTIRTSVFIVRCFLFLNYFSAQAHGSRPLRIAQRLCVDSRYHATFHIFSQVEQWAGQEGRDQSHEYHHSKDRWRQDTQIIADIQRDEFYQAARVHHCAKRESVVPSNTRQARDEY